MNNIPSGAKKHRESTKPEIKDAKQLNCFLSSSSNGLVQICMTLSQWFFAQNSSIFH